MSRFGKWTKPSRLVGWMKRWRVTEDQARQVGEIKKEGAKARAAQAKAQGKEQKSGNK